MTVILITRDQCVKHSALKPKPNNKLVTKQKPTSCKLPEGSGDLSDCLQTNWEGQKFIMSQASLNYTQSASPSSRWTPVLRKRGFEQLVPPQLYGNLQSHICCHQSLGTAALQSSAMPPFMLGRSCSRGCAKTWISKLRRERAQAEFKLTETMPQQLRWAPGWMEAGMEPEQPCSGQRSRQWLKHSWFLMKPLCRAGDGSSGQDTALAWMDGWAARRDWSSQHWDFHCELGPCQCPVPISASWPIPCTVSCVQLWAPARSVFWGNEVGKRNSPSLSLSCSVFVKYFWNHVNNLI